MLTAHLDGLGIGAAGRRRRDLQRRARQCRRGRRPARHRRSSMRRTAGAAAPLDPVRRSDRRGEGPARLALVRAEADRAARLDRRQPQLRHGAAALPADRRDRARRRGEQPRRRRPRGRRGDGPAGAPGPLSGSATASSAPTNIRSSRAGIPAVAFKFGFRAGTPEAATEQAWRATRLSQPAATMSRRPCSARTRSGCTISSPRSRFGSPTPRLGRAGTSDSFFRRFAAEGLR